MAVRSGQLVVGTTAVVLPETCVMPWRLEIKNMDNSDDLFIGEEGVTTSNGLRLAKLERVTLTLAPLDRIYLVSAKAGHNVGYLVFTQAC